MPKRDAYLSNPVELQGISEDMRRIPQRQEQHKERIVEPMFSAYLYKHISPYKRAAFVRTLYTCWFGFQELASEFRLYLGAGIEPGVFIYMNSSNEVNKNILQNVNHT